MKVPTFKLLLPSKNIIRETKNATILISIRQFTIKIEYSGTSVIRIKRVISILFGLKKRKPYWTKKAGLKDLLSFNQQNY